MGRILADYDNYNSMFVCVFFRAINMKLSTNDLRHHDTIYETHTIFFV